ncbi:helix-turn-helix domain-containing protein [Streptomyces sp. NPDC058773]|uniref:helix-turn-helix domain-containing protein n=1 Tax=Streptomyces sp. NPDC058773 TaxID=3346632 RepID=UPI0036B2DE32
MADDALSRTCCPVPCARLSLWAGRALYSGPSLELDMHSGSVTCLAVGEEDGFTVETAADGMRRTARSALIRPRVVHRIEAHVGRMTFCYFEPGSAAERACREALGAGEEPVTVSGAAELDLVHRLCAAPERAERPDIDPRIRAAVRRLLREPHLQDGATEYATAAGLSRSRFLHLFRAETGTSFRRYRMWARMLRAGRALRGLGTLTAAAAEAGFASPSHLSSTFHATFGVRPSRVLGAGCVIVEERESAGAAAESLPWRQPYVRG